MSGWVRSIGNERKGASHSSVEWWDVLLNELLHLLIISALSNILLLIVMAVWLLLLGKSIPLLSLHLVDVVLQVPLRVWINVLLGVPVNPWVHVLWRQRISLRLLARLGLNEFVSPEPVLLVIDDLTVKLDCLGTCKEECQHKW